MGWWWWGGGGHSAIFIVIFGMAAMPFLCNSILFFQCNLPSVLPVLILKYASCLNPYIDSFLFLCGEWSSLVLKDFQKYFLSQMFFLFAATVLKIFYYCFLPVKLTHIM